MFMSCGSGRDDLWYNDVHALNLSTGRWSRLEIGGMAPSPRDYATISVVASKVSQNVVVLVSGHQPATISTWSSLVDSVVLVERRSVFQTFIMWISPQVSVATEHCMLFHQFWLAGNFKWHAVTVLGHQLPARYAHSAIFYKEKVTRMI